MKSLINLYLITMQRMVPQFRRTEYTKHLLQHMRNSKRARLNYIFCVSVLPTLNRDKFNKIIDNSKLLFNLPLQLNNRIINKNNFVIPMTV